MKCANCGTELKLGCIYCSKCGKEAQIVPDYNIIEDDIASFLNEENSKKEKSDSAMPENKKKGKDNKRKNTIIAVCTVGAVLLLTITVAILISSNKKNNSFSYQYQRAVDYMDVGRYDKAYDCLKRALEIEPDSEEGNIAMGQWYYNQKKTTNATNSLLGVIEQHPDSYDAYELLLTIYREEGDYQSIIKLSENVTDKKVMALFDNYVVKSPKVEKEEGEYDTFLTVSLTVSDDVQIFYTLDGTDPVKNGKLYTNEIELEEGTTTIRAVAMNDYSIYSKEVTATYEIKLKVPEAPTASLNSGTYENQEKISFTVPEGSTIYFTWDGTTPTARSDKYTGSFKMIEGNNVLSVIAVNENNMISEVARYNYIYLPGDNNEDSEESDEN